MPTTISVAAFVVGLLLVVAALIGQVIKAKEIELPAITGGKRIVIGLFGAVLMLFGANDGKLLPTVASDPVSAASAAPPVVQNTAGRVKISDIKSLPNEARARIASIKVEYGCVVLLSNPEREDDQLRICQNMPALPTEWQTKTLRIGADCASRTGKGPIALVFANPGYEVRTWEYSFAC